MHKETNMANSKLIVLYLFKGYMVIMFCKKEGCGIEDEYHACITD
jgi:hypothetical protein